MFSFWILASIAAISISNVLGEVISGSCDMDNREAKKLTNKNIAKIKESCGEVCQTDLK